MRVRRKPDHNTSAYVYRHIRLDTNQVFYIGIGIGYSYQRAFQKTYRSDFWQKITKKTEWYAEIMIDGITRPQAQEKEKEFIALYKRRKEGGTLCNLSIGGEGACGLTGKDSPNYGKKHTPERIENMRKAVIASITDETRKKISEAARRRPPVSEETRAKLKAIALKGPDHPKFGKPMAESVKEKLRLKRKGKIMSQATKDKISAFNKGKVNSPETKFKMIQAALLRERNKRKQISLF